MTWSRESLDGVLPKSVLALRNYSVEKFTGDLVAGITVGLVALPLAMAFAIASGVPPKDGIYGAIVAGFIISALGGSTAQIGGPTGAFVVVVSGIVQAHGVQGLFTCTLMAGVMLVAMGLTGLGTAVKFIPRPVVIGFTNGIAVLIASTQVKDFFGLDIANPSGEFVGRMEQVGQHLRQLSPTATALAAISLLTLIVFTRWIKRVPGAIVVLLVGTAVAFFTQLPVETIQSRFGEIPQGLPPFQVPPIRGDLFMTLLPSAITIAMLGAIESLLSAVVADRMTGDRHQPNTELFAQGVANIVSPLFSGLPATGAIARTATNIRSGGRTPVAGMIHAVVLLIILLVAAPLAKHIPLGVLAAILFMVAYNMGEWKEIPQILKLGKADIAVWLITFLLTVLADLTVAVQAGMILAALLYIRRVTSTTTVAEVTQDYIDEGFAHSLQTNPIPDGVKVFRIHGPFLFGSTEKLTLIEDQIDQLPKIVMLRLRNMTAIDATGLHALESLADKLHASGRHLVLCAPRSQPAKFMEQAEFHRHIGPDNLQPSLSAAIERAKQLLQPG